MKVVHDWLERTCSRRPYPPASAIDPTDGATVEGTRIAFRWTPATDADGDTIRDCHFELSEHADMRWPLSPNFEKLISRTVSRSKPQWTVPCAGLLNPGTVYYWRVRALDATGVWGPWSSVFRFQCEAPGVPLEVKLVRRGNGFLLTWRANPEGRTPVAYKVYGSDEKGFSVSDSEYIVFRGKGFVRTMEEYRAKPADAPDAGMVKTPANLITRVEVPSLQVVGPELELENTNRAYYRVVAVDEKGNESGPSEYAEVPRPFVYTAPPTTATVGKPYRYTPVVIRSIGDLRCRRSKESSYNAAFWDREVFTFAAGILPAGFSLDAESGMISGIPARAGTYPISLTVTGPAGKTAVVSCRLTVTD